MRYIIKLLCVNIILTLFLSFQTIKAQKGYWQQEVNYKINVELNDLDHLLIANIEIDYINNSPTTLNEIYFHIWPEAYSSDNSAFAIQQIENKSKTFYKSSNEERGSLTGLDFSINGKAASFKIYNNQPDIIILQLPEPLESNKSCTIKTPFQVKIPNSFSRLGHVDQAYQITQWYPKPAVYDKNGWHPIPYLDQGEFYSEFGSFDVSITLPENYVVGATGDLQTSSEKIFLTQKIKETSEKSVFSKDSVLTSSLTKKTIRYTQSNVHDFAWFADKEFNVLQGSVKLPNSNDSVILYSMFTNKNSKFWLKSLPYLHDAIYYYSLWNGNYPYKQVTAVDGALSAGGGMEYPNVTVIGNINTDKMLETVIMHEVGHNWFYGILGSNERDNAWMDEGINTFNERRYIRTKYPNDKLVGKFAENPAAKILGVKDYPSGYENYLLYLLNARKNEDQPIQLSTQFYSEINSGVITYFKTGLVLNYLETYLGTEIFDKAMQTYFQEWKFKHPQPEDLKAVFEKTSGKNLDWFFKDIILTTKKVDFTIKKVKKLEDGYVVSIKSKTDFAAPVFVSSFNYKNKLIETKKIEPFTGISTVNFNSTNIKSFKIDSENKIPEINQSNNFSRTSGILKKTEQIRLQLLASFEKRDRTQLFYTPVIGYNFNDGFMAGLALYNSILPAKKFEFALVPLYGFKSKQLNGTGQLAYNWYPTNTFQRITLSSNYNQFTYFTFSSFNSLPQKDLKFQKIQGMIDFELKRKSFRSSTKEFISFRSVLTNVDQVELSFDSFASGYSGYSKSKNLFNELTFRSINSRLINPYNFRITLQQEETFLKAETEFNFNFTYKKLKKAAELRVFVGSIVLQNNNYSTNYNFSFNGNSDYLYDQVFLDRSKVSDTFLDQQLSNNDGGFKNITTANPGKYMFAANAKVPFPIGVPLGLYGDVGISDYKDSFNNNAILFYDAGLYVPLFKNVLEVYFPLVISSDLNQLTYGQKISFVLNLKSINPLNLVKNISL